MKNLFLIFLTLSFIACSKKDISRSSSNNRNNTDAPAQGSVRESSDQQIFTPKKTKSYKKKSSFGDNYWGKVQTAEEAQEKRMKMLVKKHAKEAKLKKKPQYSDFSYFGHKRKPKINDPDKRKLCKECGIVH